MRPFSRSPRHATLVGAAVLVLALAPAPLPAQAIGIGFFGIGLGTRTGFSISAGVQVTDEVQLICKAGGMPTLITSVSCGTHLYLLDNPDWFYVAEVGFMERAPHPVFPVARTEKRFFFVEGGAGWRDHEFPDDEDDDDEPEYLRWANVSWSAGLTLVLAKSERDVVPTDSGEVHGPRRLSPSIWPLFFWDAQAEAYLPGRDCRKC